MKILKQDCKKDEAQDKTLPYTCYLIIYKVDGVVVNGVGSTPVFMGTGAYAIRGRKEVFSAAIAKGNKG